eukprot:CAMPEP_0175100556 /NCGR_PEP_ID=MMETSP0086_2-20121207/7191_1 /TAXON_ID=136419 /ORGANISM="Unknown Unknown, Strain D1" /LENGTH=112 /DNA_ID=CAMNT_0016374757 /DNA_START=72 /DNA_END=410 /DNA_ORIENTATION=-
MDTAADHCTGKQDPPAVITTFPARSSRLSATAAAAVAASATSAVPDPLVLPVSSAAPIPVFPLPTLSFFWHPCNRSDNSTLHNSSSPPAAERNNGCSTSRYFSSTSPAPGSS